MRSGLLAIVLAACGSPAPASPDAPAFSEAGLEAGPAPCTGACQVTALTATFAATRVLDRAHFGVTASNGTLHVEAHRGGGTGCPSDGSPTPDYTLVLGRVTATAPGSSPGNILDFVGDLLGGPLGAAATTVAITPVASDPDFVALDIELTFEAGTIAGHLYATHCTSLDSP
jgi:hypothetical protein